MIIPVHHIVVANIPVQANTKFEQGYALALDSNGFAVLADGNGSGNTDNVLGLFADRNRDAEAYEYLNRVSDMGNDSAGSGLASMYTGGFFYVDVDEGASGNLNTPLGTAVRGVITSGSNVVPGAALYVSDSEPGRLTTDTGDNTSGQIVGYCIEAAADLESGIPGEYEPGSSLKLTDDTQPRQWVKIKLSV